MPIPHHKSSYEAVVIPSHAHTRPVPCQKSIAPHTLLLPSVRHPKANPLSHRAETKGRAYELMFAISHQRSASHPLLPLQRRGKKRVGVVRQTDVGPHLGYTHDSMRVDAGSLCSFFVPECVPNSAHEWRRREGEIGVLSHCERIGLAAIFWNGAFSHH